MSRIVITDEDAADLPTYEEPEPDPTMLRIASNPTSSSARLAKLFESGWGNSTQVRDALLGNPSIPLDLLRRMLRIGHRAAWHNPVVPLLLQSEPLLEYREAAARVLGTLTPAMPHKSSLEALVVHWSRIQPVAHRPREAAYHALARRLAELFGLPWPAEVS